VAGDPTRGAPLVAVGIFTDYNLLLYVARSSDTDEQAIYAARRRGLQLPPVIIVRRPNMPAKRYRYEDGVITPMIEPIE
jgi:hypothetical protein